MSGRATEAPGATTGLGSPAGLRLLGWATLVANAGLVVTGGAVRLTGSGLGCPTWPRCTEDSFTPYGAMDVHKAIEFGNRTLTFVLAAVAIATVVAAVRSSRGDLRALAVAIALGIPAQAVIGGVTVLTRLNPWVVSLHLIASLAIVALATVFLHRLDHPGPARASGPVVSLAWVTFAVCWVVFYIGTIVTGSGPHAGDAEAPRNGLDPERVSQLHADAVFLLLGLSVALAFGLYAVGAAPVVRRAGLVVLAVEVGQGAIGYVQYFTDLPVVLVGLHMLGSTVLCAVLTRLLLLVRGGVAASDRSSA